MNRITLLIIALAISILSFGQQYGKYSLPHTTDNNILKEYVGKRVKVLHSIEGHHDNYWFELRGRVLEKEYIIKNIKANKKEIKIDLADSSGMKYDVTVNANGNGEIGMNSCNSFFLVDDFKKDNESIIGTVVTDGLGNAIAQVVDIDVYGGEHDAKTLYTIKMISDEQKYLCSPDILNQIFSKIGTNLSHSNIKHSYTIQNIKATCRDNKYDVFKKDYYYKTNGGSYLPKEKTELPEITDNGLTEYEITNNLTGEVSTCPVKDASIHAFDEDLKGHYVSVLNSVEKPSNPEIRYGETSIVTDDNITKYSYIDNYIDIVIFNGSVNLDRRPRG